MPRRCTKDVASAYGFRGAFQGGLQEPPVFQFSQSNARIYPEQQNGHETRNYDLETRQSRRLVAGRACSFQNMHLISRLFGMKTKKLSTSRNTCRVSPRIH